MNYKEIKNKITRFIHDQVGLTGLNNVVIGISGGIDSAVITTLAVEALGKDRVIGILMPATVNDMNKDSFKNSLQLVRQLDIKYVIIPVSMIFDPEYRLYLGREKEEVDRVRIGNIMARMRMTILYDQAMENNAIVLGTTNKTEMLLGYFTKWGDGGVDIEPIAGLYKTEIFELAEFLGVPDEIINATPSAGLWEGQTDEGEIGTTYKNMDQILWWIEEEGYDANILINKMEELTDIKDKNIILKVVGIMTRNYHKRVTPPSCEIDRTK